MNDLTKKYIFTSTLSFIFSITFISLSLHNYTEYVIPYTNDNRRNQFTSETSIETNVIIKFLNYCAVFSIAMLCSYFIVFVIFVSLFCYLFKYDVSYNMDVILFVYILFYNLICFGTSVWLISEASYLCNYNYSTNKLYNKDTVKSNIIILICWFVFSIIHLMHFIQYSCCVLFVPN